MAMKKRPAKKAAPKKKPPQKKKAAKKTTRKSASTKAASVKPIYFGGGTMKWPYSQLLTLIPFYRKHGLEEEGMEIVRKYDFEVTVPAEMVDAIKKLVYERGLHDIDPVAAWIVSCPCEPLKHI